MKHVSIKNLVSTLALAAGLTFSASAHAATVYWTSWTAATAGSPGSASGTIAGLGGGVTVNYSGQIESISGTSQPNWLPAGSFSGGTVTNAPNASAGENGIRLVGGGTYTETVTFSQAINNPTFAFWSLGGGGTTVSFNFGSPITFDGGGASTEYGGSAITCTGNTASGIEANGVCHFTGNFTSISFTTPQSENFYAFTVGAPSLAVTTPTGTPEPSSLALLGTGLAGLAGFAKRRFNRS